MRTIAIVNAKGGSGKSTLATGLAAALAWEGYEVMLGDMDPQQSSHDWLALRPEAYPTIHAGERGSRSTDFLILDTPAGLAGAELRKVLKRANTVLMPILPSPIDMRAAWRFLDGLLNLKDVQSRNVALGLVANRVRPQTLIYRELTGFLDDYRVPVVAELRDSMNYVRANERGLAVVDLPAYLAEEDWAQWEVLVKWVLSRQARGKR